MRRCLIYLDEQALQDSVDLLEVARQIHASDDDVTTGVTFGADIRLAAGAFDSIIQVSHPQLKTYDPLAVTEVLVELQEKNAFDTILVPATPFGRMLAPRLAMRLKTGLVADVTAIRHEGGQLLAIRPAYSGRIMAAILFHGTGPVMMSIRPGVFHWDRTAEKNTQTEFFAPTRVRDGNLHRLAVKAKEQTYDIRESDVLVSGGGGMIGHFQELERLAQSLGGQVSASRKIVDQGLASRSIQVGQSGKTVSPKLYLALGIDGAVQHVEGLKQVQHIISVNLNKNAPICSLSDIVVEGDAVTFIDKLVAKINQEASD
ncbi:MAG: electron transfer flavoprotein subunit alpha/FixB family protein [Clostridia bacterium]|nr:electron transfer flavoprotein subunit alpha/FixB family protein [Clostridia bacterium]